MLNSPLSPLSRYPSSAEKEEGSGPCQIFGLPVISGIGMAGIVILANHRLNTSFFC
jgi:hypothetical protein